MGILDLGFNHLIPEFTGLNLAICPERDLLILKPFEIAQQRIVIQIFGILVAITDKDFDDPMHIFHLGYSLL